MIGNCDCCLRANVPVSNARMSGMEATACYRCQGHDEDDPYQELGDDLSKGDTWLKLRSAPRK